MIKDFESKVNEMLLKQQGFDHPVFGDLRIIMKDDEPWFVLNEVCKTLNIKNNASSNFDFLEGGGGR